METTVALVNTRPETVLHDLDRVMRLAGAREAARRSDQHTLVLDLAWWRGGPTAGTPPWQLDAAVRMLREAGAPQISLQPAAIAGPGTSLDRARARLRWDQVLAAHGLDLADLDAAARVAAASDELAGSCPWLAHAQPQGITLPEPCDGRGIVLLPVLRTDRSLGLRGAVAAHLAWLPARLRDEARRRPSVWPELLRLRERHAAGTLVVMDATVCGDSPGPGARPPVQANLLLAGSDPAAVDAVAAGLLGLDPRRLPWLRGCAPQEITVTGDLDARAWRLPLPPLAGGPRRWPSPQAAALIRDWIWYPTAGRRAWRRLGETPWGRLLSDYEVKEPS